MTSPADPPPAPEAGEASPFIRVRARVAVLLMLAAGVAVEALRRTVLGGVPEAWWDPAGSLLFMLALGGLLVAYLRRRAVRVGRLVGDAPRGWRAWGLAAVAAPLLLLSLGTAALQFSLFVTLAPGMAAGLLADDGTAAAAAGTGAVLLTALAGVTAAVVEELLFRGVLLTRWEQRWGAWRAALASSLAFGLLHLDPVGAFVFGMAMCCLYLRTRSLLVPMLAHGLNNAIVALSDLGDASGTVALQPAADLAPDWGAGALALAVSLPALVWFFRACPPRRTWRLPYYDSAGF
ncbi:MAG TPA: CPBP family intramembrane glutamic endopeptidase [Longimicrobium sp.]|nr:CPBP family intramembrane glutamic endopeptidase [Longimicrobium sp.]